MLYVILLVKNIIKNKCIMAKNNLLKYAAAAPVLALTGACGFTIGLDRFIIGKNYKLTTGRVALIAYTGSLIATSIYILKT